MSFNLAPRCGCIMGACDVLSVGLSANFTGLTACFSDSGANGLTGESREWALMRVTLFFRSWEDYLEPIRFVFYSSWKHVHIHCPVRTIFAQFHFPTSSGGNFSTLLVLLIVIGLEAFSYRLLSTGWGNKEGQWVGTIVQVCRLINSYAGNTPISSNGVLRYFNCPSNGPLFSAAAFLRMRFVVCTALSPAAFECGHSSELVAR